MTLTELEMAMRLMQAFGVQRLKMGDTEITREARAPAAAPRVIYPDVRGEPVPTPHMGPLEAKATGEQLPREVEPFMQREPTEEEYLYMSAGPPPSDADLPNDVNLDELIRTTK